MAAAKQFRSALNGFNREDVVHYIEYLNNQHRSQVEQLNNQLQAALARQDNSDLQAQLDEALAKCAQLEAQLKAQPAPADTTAQELEAYRRAERTERVARERAQQIFTQANAVLADASLKAEAAAASIGSLADQAAAQLKQCQESVLATKEAFQDAVQTLYAIRPEEI
jgi:chromosome segregation ATPase